MVESLTKQCFSPPRATIATPRAVAPPVLLRNGRVRRGEPLARHEEALPPEERRKARKEGRKEGVGRGNRGRALDIHDTDGRGRDSQSCYIAFTVQIIIV